MLFKFTWRGNKRDKLVQFLFQSLNGWTDVGLVTSARLGAMYSDQNEQCYAKTFRNSRKVKFKRLTGWLSRINDFADCGFLFTRREYFLASSLRLTNQPLPNLLFTNTITRYSCLPDDRLLSRGNLPQKGGSTEITTYYVGFEIK